MVVMALHERFDQLARAATLGTKVFSRIKEAESGCWEWTGTITDKGYGVVNMPGDDRLRLRAHRVVYELLVGPIPDGLHLDHLCRVRCCVNPAHLEPVTQAENNRRSDGIPALNARKTHCVHGHEFTPENTYRNPNTGERKCRTCTRRHQQARTLKAREAAA